ncbi:MAG: recombinase family protein [Campylobacterales bacterium]|nr:recombinase family protein [Campylobacterales bacterium]
MATIGYIRVSTSEQNTARQLDGIKLDKVFTDKISGKNAERPELQKCLEYIREGDTLICHSLDRLARNLDDLRKIVKTLTQSGIEVQFLKENLTFTGEDSPMSNLLLSVIGAFAEFERNLIKERQAEGIAIAKIKGVYKGRQPSLTDAQIEEIRAMLDNGVAKSVLARKYTVSRQTIYNIEK